MNFRDYTPEQLKEESLIELAYAILEEKQAALPLADLLNEIKALNGISEEELKSRLLQFYTDLNVEGRFLLNQENGWGLREWYKVDQIEEETAPTVKSRKKKKAVSDEDEELVDLDEEDVVFEEDFDEFADEEEADEADSEVLDFATEGMDDIDEDIDEELIEEDGFIIEEDEEEDEEDEDLK